MAIYVSPNWIQPTFNRQPQHGSRCSPHRNPQRSSHPLRGLLDLAENGLRVFDEFDEGGFRPKFNVRDFKDHYEITGEVPGLTKEKIVIQVSDSSINVSGNSEHLSTTESPKPGPSSSQQRQQHRDHQQHQPSVEDEDAEWTSASGHTEGESTKTPEQQQQQQQKEDGKPSIEVAKTSSQTNVAQRPRSPQGRLIVTERTFGQFAREFRFQDKIDREVSATLEDGILRIVAKKILPEGPTRITIQ